MRFFKYIIYFCFSAQVGIRQSLVEYNAMETADVLINPYSGLVNYGLESSYGNYLRKIPQYIYPQNY